MATTKTTAKRPSRAEKAGSKAAKRSGKARRPPARDPQCVTTLPFAAHRLPLHGMCVPVNCGDFDWCDSEAEVARAALAAGFQVSFPCDPAAVARGVSWVQRALGIPVCAGYLAFEERVVLWRMPVDEDDEATPITRETCPRCGCFGCGFEASKSG